MHILDLIALTIGIIGMIIIIWGVFLVIIEFVRMEYAEAFNKQTKKDRNYLRRHLGAYIILGLEFMIAGDIIHTVLKPNKDALIVLGSIVAIRTVISYFLNKELKENI